MKICERCAMKKAVYMMGLDNTYLCEPCSSLFTTEFGSIPYLELKQ